MTFVVIGKLRVKYNTISLSKQFVRNNHNVSGLLHRGTYMSAHVLSNLLNELGKSDKM